jgi:Asp-tRNA(Asn)/Glu-tRNA(Gln) amidotransferase A subunit family amidase
VFELHHLTAQEQWDWLHRGEVTPSELAEHYLARIERLNDELARGNLAAVQPVPLLLRGEVMKFEHASEPRPGRSRP